MSGIGILGIGVFLPGEPRTNDYWPAAVVERWREALARNAAAAEKIIAEQEQTTEGMRSVLRALQQHAADPFQGTRSRHAIEPGASPSDLELVAARRALDAAGINISNVDILSCFSAVPDHLTVTNACLLHRKLGLRRDCLTFGVDSAGNSFLHQLELARALLAQPERHYALLVQSTAWSRLVPTDAYFAPTVGDAATAVVVGRVSGRRGILASAHFTDGSRYEALVTGVPGKRWHEGTPVTYSLSPKVAFEMLLAIPDRAMALVTRALQSADLTTRDVDFYASYQGTVWIGPLAQASSGLSHARALHTFPWTGHVNTCAIPIALFEARERKLLHDDEIAVCFAGGSGETICALILRYGT